MRAGTARRIWTETAGCAFCLRTERGWVWCRELCNRLPLTEVVRRVVVLRENATRANLGLRTRRGPVAVPNEPTTCAERATVCRINGVERIVKSQRRLSKAQLTRRRSEERLEATRRALEASRMALEEP